MSAIDAIREKLKRYPELPYEESPDCVRVPPATADGFPVSLQQDGRRYIVSFAGWHEHFETESEALKCFGFGLSEQCRLRVESRGSLDYRWTVQYFREHGWSDYSRTGLLLIPFWLRRRERYLQNHAVKVA